MTKVIVSDLMTRVYVLVDDVLRCRPEYTNWRRSNNAHPVFTDAEVLTIALMRPLLGLATLKDAYRLIAGTHRDCFPALCGYQQWVRRLQPITPLLGVLLDAIGQSGIRLHVERRADELSEHLRFDAESPQQHAYRRHGVELDALTFVIDSKPLPVVSQRRIAAARLLRDDGAYFGKSSCGWYFGFKLHVLEHRGSGMVVNAMLTAANYDDRPGLQLCEHLPAGAIVLGDEGYNGDDAFDELAEEVAAIRVMPSDKTRKTKPGEKRQFKHSIISTLRQSIETLFSQCCRKSIDRVLARSFNGLWAASLITLVAYNIDAAHLLPP